MSYKKVTLQSQAPSVFVGISEYPNLNVGILSTKKDDFHDNPHHWAKHEFNIEDVVKRRRGLLNSSIQTIANTRNEKLVELSQELAMANESIDFEMEVEPRNLSLLSSQGEAIPYGPRAQLFDAQAVSNISVDKRIERAVSDTDLKATTAIAELYGKTITEHQISKLLSVGNLGVEKNRKLVPTRWSITATDDTLGKQLLKQLPEFDTSHSHVLSANYMGNYFLILVFDREWSFELVEILPDKKTIKHDCELTYGRSAYVTETAGAYYAVRLAVLEYLTAIKKQASVVVLRFITPEYNTPLGVWVVRETVRKALSSSQIEFDSKKLVSEYARAWSKKKFGFEYSTVLKKSILLQEILSQKNLKDFFE